MKAQIELPVPELKIALAGFAKIICRSSCLPVLRSIRVSLDAAGVLALQATDLESIATYQAEETANIAPVTFLVPFDPLVKTVKAASTKDRIGFIREAKDRVVVRSLIGNTPIEEVLETPAIEDWPVTPAVNNPAMTLTEEFKVALKEALDCCEDPDASRYVLTGACLDTAEPQNHYVVGTDGRHLYAANSFCFDWKERVIIPNRKFLLWPTFINDGTWSLAVQPGKELPPKTKDAKPEKEPSWAKITAPRWTFTTRLIDGEFPSAWKQVIPESRGMETVLRLAEEPIKSMLEILPRLPGAESHNSPVTLLVDDKQLLVRGRNNDKSPWTTIPVPGASILGKPVEVCLNRTYLTKALRMGLSEIEINAEIGVPLVCRSTGKMMIIMPINTKAPPTPAPADQTESAPPEPAAEIKPSEPQPPPPTETIQERNTTSMTQTTASNAAKTSEAEAKSSAMKGALDHLEKIKTALREVIGQLNDTATLLKAAEKENRATEKEFESVRATLRSLQKVSI